MRPTKSLRRVAAARPLAAVCLTAALAPLMGACDKDEEPSGTSYCEAWADEVAEVSRTLDSRYDDCSRWTMPAGDHLYVNVYVYQELVDCAHYLDDGLEIFASPTYSDFTDDGMKWTYDVTGAAAVEDGAFEVSCDDGVIFEARLTITE